VRLKPSGFMNI